LSHTEEVPIGKHKFYIRRFPVRKAMRLSGDLARDYLGPASAAIAEKSVDQDMVQAFAAALSRTFQSTGGDKIEQLMNTLLDPECITVVVGETPRKLTSGEFDLLNLDVAEVYELLGAVLRVNFLSLWERAKNLFGLAQTSLQAAPPDASSQSYRMN
jgi:hypothetical protein